MIFMDSEGRPFYSAGKPVHQPDYVLFCRRGPDDKPINQEKRRAIGYFNYSSVARDRRAKFQARPHPGDGHNYPVGRLFQKRLSQITPVEWKEDPYLLCILLSITQLQKRVLSSSNLTVYTVYLAYHSYPDHAVQRVQLTFLSRDFW
jgi:hypothetical protein